MKKILVLVNNYLPVKSADSYCFKKMEKILAVDNILHIVTLGEKKTVLHNHNSTIFSLTNGPHLDLKIIDAIIKTVKFKFIAVFLIQIIRILSKIFKFVVFPDTSFLYVKRYKNFCFQLIREGNYDCVLSVVGSYIPCLIGDSIKGQFGSDINWIVLLYDPLPIDNLIYRKSVNIFLKKYIAKSIISKSDKIIALKFLIERLDKIVISKTIECGIPLIEEFSIKPKKIVNSQIELAYIGSLNLNVRNPEFLLKVISQSKFKTKIIIHFYGAEISNRLLDKYKVKKNIMFHGVLTKGLVAQIYENNYLLINIGNKIDYQIPSKLFEYISTGLPIISFEKNSSFKDRNILNNYNNSLTLFEDDKFELNILNFDKFISKPIVRMPFDEIRFIYKFNTPEWNADLILQMCSKFHES